MPSKTRDKGRDHNADTSKSKEKRHRSSGSRRSSAKDPDKASHTSERRHSHVSPSVKRTASMPIAELEQGGRSDSPRGSRSNLPYPSFSKAHSKEEIGSRENVVGKRVSYYTPDPTDLDRTQTESDNGGKPNTTGAPPSPPLTTVEQISEDPKTVTPPLADEDQRRASPAIDQDVRKRPSANVAKEGWTVRVERKKTDLQKNAEDLKRRLQERSNAPSGKVDRRSPLSRSRNSQREPKDVVESSSTVKSKLDQRPKLKPPPAKGEAVSTSTCQNPFSLAGSSTTDNETTTESTIDSDATSIAPEQLHLQPPSVALRSPSWTADSDSPPTPILLESSLPPSRKSTPVVVNGDHATPVLFHDSPAPPPPPPPPSMPFQMPRVDYLMHNGGLNQSVPRTLLGAGQPLQAPAQTASAQVDQFFAPFNDLLDDYSKVIARSGSLAVATGYRSIARRLLDRLEAVFARDISSETCACIACESSPMTAEDVQNQQGVSWGEILEYVCGRQELPQWPPFVLNSVQGGLGISGEDQKPMQNLDIDVPEEFRDHYVRQSKKTKQSVDNWLASQPDSPIGAPTDVDDETLTFAMLTRLEPEQRPIFSSLVGVAPSRPPSRASASLMSPRSSLLETTGLAIQRLYRLDTPPRDPESAIYLLTNPTLHNVLATLAAISDHEWEILTSGRFDGFLRSGAEDHPNHIAQAHPQSRGPTPARMTPSVPNSRNPTPFSRNQTPASGSVGAPVSLDEETEIAVLAEIEREIFLGMEALEDAFEALHSKAETVRCALRERGAGLSMAAQSRRGSGNLDARIGTPADGTGSGRGIYGWDSETDDGIEDGMSELAPDDSASNVSRSRTRRPKRRTERRTPAPVEEEDEGSEED
ncbi:hypothetical protein MMC07_008666 [Pseudocyphellaria aurata]|nr:hypothetical protein [Pseudocyphellaria aurata]